MSVALKVFHHLPYLGRNLAATMHGFYLRNWRYDKQTEDLVAAALERDYWSEEKWNNWRQERLSFLLHRAATQVPFYREQWAKRRLNGDKSSWEYLENWRILEKQDLRDQKTDFVADDCDRSRMYCEKTSGTTGASLSLWWAPSTVKNWYALFEARCRRWYGVSRHDRWANIGGQLIIPFRQTKPPFWVRNGGLNQLYMSVYHLAPGQIDCYPDALVKYRIDYIFGYSSAIFRLAQAVRKSKRRVVKMKVVVTNAEPLFEYQREVIEAAFDCPVRETYGMAEIVATASECEQGRLHLWQDVGIVETEADYLSDNGSGELICTGLVNADMPLIRYRVGDRARLSDEKCSCGRRLPLMEGVDGRNDDVFYTSDGRECSHIHLVQKGEFGIIESQIIQESLTSIHVKYVPDENFLQEHLDQMTNNIQSRMGNVDVTYQRVTEIPRTKGGKFRAVICNLTDNDKTLIRG